MARNPQAEIFIKTLEDMLADERECQKVRRRLQHRERAQRFVQAFWSNLDAGRRPSGWIPQGRQPETEASRPMRNE